MALKKILTKVVLWTVVILLLLGIGYAYFFIHKLNALGNKINAENKTENLFETLGSVVGSSGKDGLAGIKMTDDGRINILLLGIAGEGKPGQYLTDTIIIASINTKTNQVSLLSLPRDMLAVIPEKNLQMKINSLYQYGRNNSETESEAIDPLLQTINKVTALDIQYYAVLNFDGFIKIIDSIGGINIENERDIFDSRYPGPNYSYETFELKKGFYHMDGATALKYSRERHDDPEGDFGRSKRQQQTLQAVKNRIFSTNTLLDINSLNNLFQALGDNIKTNLSIEDLKAFYELTKKLDTTNIVNVTIDAWNTDSLLKVSHIFYGDVRAFVLIPRVGNYSEIQEQARDIFDLNKIKRRRDEISKEDANIVLINRSGNKLIPDKILKLLNDNLVYKNVKMLSDSSKDLEDNTVVYDTNNGTKPFTLDELATKLPATVSYEAFPGKYQKMVSKEQPDVVVIIGKDLIDKYSMEEDSVEAYKNSQDDQAYLNFNNLEP